MKTPSQNKLLSALHGKDTINMAQLKSELFFDFLKGIADNADTKSLNKKAVYDTAKQHFGVDGKVLGGWSSALSRKGLISVTPTTITLV